MPTKKSSDNPQAPASIRTFFRLVEREHHLELEARERGEGAKQKCFSLNIPVDDPEYRKKFNPEKFLRSVTKDHAKHEITAPFFESEVARDTIHYTLARGLDFYTPLLFRAFPHGPIQLLATSFTPNVSEGTKHPYLLCKVRYKEVIEGKPQPDRKHVVRSLGVETLSETAQVAIERLIKALTFRALDGRGSEPLDEPGFHRIVDEVVAPFVKKNPRDLSRSRKTDIPIEKIETGPLTVSGPHLARSRGGLKVEFRIRHTVDKDRYIFCRISRRLGIDMPGEDYPEIPEEVRTRIKNVHEVLIKELTTMLSGLELTGDRPFVTESSASGLRKLKFSSDQLLFAEVSQKVPEIAQGHRR